MHLANRPFLVLLHLVENRDRMVSRKELLDLFWDGKEVYENTLTKCVGAIRKAMSDTLETPRFIETQWAKGYRYIGPLEESFSQAPADGSSKSKRSAASGLSLKKKLSKFCRTAKQRLRYWPGAEAASASSSGQPAGAAQVEAAAQDPGAGGCLYHFCGCTARRARGAPSLDLF